MADLKTIRPETIPVALERARHYRLLNEPEDAESICLDILAVDPDHQDALRTLILARTDQFEQGLSGALQGARDVLKRLDDEYDRAYLHGLICERQAKAQLRRRGRRAGFVAYDWFQQALDLYARAIELAEPGDEEALLRWNTCQRLIERYPHCLPDPQEQAVQGIE